eukprot:1152079-Pelagomonas_calceolata.AAC.14
MPARPTSLHLGALCVVQYTIVKMLGTCVPACKRPSRVMSHYGRGKGVGSGKASSNGCKRAHSCKSGGGRCAARGGASGG